MSGSIVVSLPDPVVLQVAIDTASYVFVPFLPIQYTKQTRLN